MSGYDSYFYPKILLASATPNVVLADIYDDVVSMTYESEERGMDKVTISLRNPDMKYMNDPRFRFGIRFYLRFGYSGRMTRTKVLVVKGLTPVYGSGMNVIELTSFDTGLDLAQRTGPRNWGALSSSEIATKVASMFGLRPVIEDSGDGRKGHRIQPASVSFYEYLDRLADSIGFEFFVDDSALIFRKMNLDQPEGRFTYYGSGFTLLKGFVPSVDAARPPATRHANTNESGRAARSEQTGASASDERAAQNQGRFRIGLEDLSTRVVPADSTGEAQREVTRPTAETDRNVRARQVMAEQTKIEMGAVEASAEFIGDPFIMARKVLDIRGVDAEYVGPWRVKRASHTISESGYATSTQLKKLGKNRGDSRHRTPEHQRANESSGGGREGASESGGNTFRIRTESLSTSVVERNANATASTGGGVG